MSYHTCMAKDNTIHHLPCQFIRLFYIIFFSCRLFQFFFSYPFYQVLINSTHGCTRQMVHCYFNFRKEILYNQCTPDNCCNLQPNILLLFIHTKNGRKKNSCCLMLSRWNSGIVDQCYAIEQVLLCLFPIFSGLLSSLWMRQASHSKVALFVSQLLNLLNKAKLEASWSLQIQFKW